MKIWSNIVVGGGLSGLLLAKRLKSLGQEVLIIDKARSVGGRMATRRDEDSSYDHGAQFSSLDLSNLSDAFSPGIWIPWTQYGSKELYNVQNGINKAAKFLASNLELALNQKVVSLKIDKEVNLFAESGEEFRSKRVFLTCPMPQTCDLLKSSQIDCPKDLSDISYAKALVGLFRLDSNHSSLINFKYFEPQGCDIFSISNQMSKGVSQNLSFSIVMNPNFSDEYFENDDLEALSVVENNLVSFFNNHLNLNEKDYKIIRSQLKKWRYSHPINPLGKDSYELIPQKVVILGDGCCGGSVVSVARSALRIGL